MTLVERFKIILADAEAMDMHDDDQLFWDAEEAPNLCVGDIREATEHIEALEAEIARWRQRAFELECQFGGLKGVFAERAALGEPKQEQSTNG